MENGKVARRRFHSISKMANKPSAAGCGWHEQMKGGVSPKKKMLNK
jgi:hypothetical protein